MNAERFDRLLEIAKKYKLYISNDEVIVEGKKGPKIPRVNSNGVKQYSLYYKGYTRYYGVHELRAFLENKPLLNVRVPVNNKVINNKVIKGMVCGICGLTYPRNEMRVGGICYLCKSVSKKSDCY